MSDVDELLPFAPTPPVPECPDCDQPKALVPPTGFWWACKTCHPGTFTRA